jgi:uncharacterized delta-60 repeat protein
MCAVTDLARRPRALALLSIAASFALPAAAHAAEAGDLDPSFGSGGLVTLPSFGDTGNGNAVAIQGDGKIVLAGSQGATMNTFALARYLPDGTLDPGFGAGGTVITALPGGNEAEAVALQEDGKILAAGTAGNDFALTRYLPDGTPDPGFGVGGTVTTQFLGAGASVVGRAVAIQPDGRIVVAGGFDSGGTNPSLIFALARYEPDGDLDTTFDGDGTLTTPFGVPPADISMANGLAIGDGTILAAGGVNNPFGGGGAFAFARYSMTDGSLDPSFNGGGRAVSLGPPGGEWNEATASAVVVLASGGIVAAGSGVSTPGESDAALVALTEAGTPDASFGAGGITTTNLPGGVAQINALARQPDGKLVIAGNVLTSPTTTQFVLARYGATGTLDPGYGAGGVVVTPVSPGGSTANGVLADAEGRLVAAGAAQTSTGSTFALARYFGSPSPSPPAPPVSPTPPGGAPKPPARRSKGQSIRSLKLSSRCVRPSSSGQVRIGLRLRLTRPGPVRIRIDRGVGTKGKKSCPPRSRARHFDGRFEEVVLRRRVATQPAAVTRRLTLTARLAPGLYRITVRAYGGGKISRPARRFVRVLSR